MKLPLKATGFSSSRRRFVTGLSAVGALSFVPSFASAHTHQPDVLRGRVFDLTIGHAAVNFTGVERFATAVNGSVPGPTLYWQEGEEITIRVTNTLPVISSIHWHGIILPTGMDGVPGLSFEGIPPGQTFTYQFKAQQHGTYWYHSHSGFQEQTGLYGAIVVLPKEQEAVSYDRDHVIMLSDWSDEAPEDIYANLKKSADFYVADKRTLGDIWADVQDKGIMQTWQERAMWNQMRMSDRDISDVTGRTYTFLMNGRSPDDSWLGIFKKGEKVRLRFINGAAMTIFDVRIPGLKMTVVAADGQLVQPVKIDEFRIATAETYDVIVEPDGSQAYTVFAQSIDRSGYARGTLTSDVNRVADVPKMDPAPVLTHRDMGMSMEHDMSGMDHSQHGMRSMDYKPKAKNLGKAGFGSNEAIGHMSSELGAHVDMQAQMPMNGVSDPGIGLRHHQHRYNRRVLKYSDLRNLYETEDQRQPSREIQLHLTGNMHRYMWSINGIAASKASSIELTYGERVRFTLVNDTMMTHPIHLHGMWSELETGDPKYLPRKHTIIVQPGSKISYLVTADALGTWAYHCHLLYHMPGMFRSIVVKEA
ncbi:MAG: copper resistance protein CopA [Cycloclasticus sp. symbiont of Bathymodiolus heckerae]|nr:MAG: copper resistance protein CopA [Cycloclasticus sp. symbiont of Bathymodiolus heckerae]